MDWFKLVIIIYFALEAGWCIARGSGYNPAPIKHNSSFWLTAVCMVLLSVGTYFWL